MPAAVKNFTLLPYFININNSCVDRNFFAVPTPLWKMSFSWLSINLPSNISRGN